MKCAICQTNEANKKNTHYLTDAIIRVCLNEGGDSEREKGAYFDISSRKAYTDFNFQRGTSPEALNEILGREATDEDIAKAKKVPFSVDNVFCTACEKQFTDIEDKFLSNYLSKFRGADLTDKASLAFEDCTIFRLFFLMQVWRTAICEPQFSISDSSKERLRELILKPDEKELKEFPLSVTYIETKGDQKEYTTHNVGFVADSKPNVILMCDFIIQFFNEPDEITFYDLYGYNNSKDYKKFINYREEQFVVKVISDVDRKTIKDKFIVETKAQPALNHYASVFSEFWAKKFGSPPSEALVKKYVTEFVQWDHIPMAERMSLKRIADFTLEFIMKNKAT